MSAQGYSKELFYNRWREGMRHEARSASGETCAWKPDTSRKYKMIHKKIASYSRSCENTNKSV